VGVVVGGGTALDQGLADVRVGEEVQLDQERAPRQSRNGCRIEEIFFVSLAVEDDEAVLDSLQFPVERVGFAESLDPDPVGETVPPEEFLLEVAAQLFPLEGDDLGSGEGAGETGRIVALGGAYVDDFGRLRGEELFHFTV